mmetsp:Transcript_13171/g.39828  ORF Transcript_13171/g.39828 Transcript_13171/m.39828 type:complete len:489 (+) Transcript_13171:217-1683(+)
MWSGASQLSDGERRSHRYFPILYVRYRLGIVTPEMLRFMYVDSGEKKQRRRRLRGAHRYIVAGGLADEAGQICSSVAQPYVSIIASTLLSQTSSVWTVLTSALVLRARYVFQEFLGLAIALGGASIEVLDIRNGGDDRTQFSMALLVLASAAAPAVSFVFKEKCFRLWHATKREREKRRLQGPPPHKRKSLWRSSSAAQAPLLSRENDDGERRASVASTDSAEPTTNELVSVIREEQGELDVWVVASAAAVWSLAWAPAVSVATSYLKKPGGMSLPRYFRLTFRCFSNDLDFHDFIDDDDGDAGRACTAAWQWWLAYMVTNVAYNVSVYRVVRLASALTSFVCGKLVTPLTVALSVLPWPVIGAGTVSVTQGLSLLVILTGVSVFRLGTVANHTRFGPDGNNDDACCWPLRLPRWRRPVKRNPSGLLFSYDAPRHSSSRRAARQQQPHFERIAESHDDDDHEDGGEIKLDRVSSPTTPLAVVVPPSSS